MFELLTILVFIWLMVGAIRLAFRLTWGLAKIVACFLMVLAAPALFFCLVFVGGIALFVPLCVIGLAFGILKACV